MKAKVKPETVVKLADVLRDEESQKLLAQTVCALIQDNLDAVVAPSSDEAVGGLANVRRELLNRIDDQADQRIEKYHLTAATVPSLLTERMLIALLFVAVLAGFWLSWQSFDDQHLQITALQNSEKPAAVVPSSITLAPAIENESEPVTTPQESPLLYVTNGTSGSCWTRVSDTAGPDETMYEGQLGGRMSFPLTRGHDYEVRDGCPGVLTLDAQNFTLTADDLVNRSKAPKKSEVFHLECCR